jgi:hypothetical protein
MPEKSFPFKDGPSRRDKIYLYIKEHPGTTQTEVIEYTTNKGISSLVTTRNLIQKLVAEKIVIVRKDRSNSQIHHLFVDEENIHERIYNQISNLEKFISKTNQYFFRLLDDYFTEDKELTENYSEEKEARWYNRSNFRNDIEETYRSVLNRMLETLFLITTNSNLPEEDIESFCIRIIELKSKVMSSYAWSSDGERKRLDAEIRACKSYENTLKKSSVIRLYNEEKKFDIKLLIPLKEMIENFKIDFLH